MLLKNFSPKNFPKIRIFPRPEATEMARVGIAWIFPKPDRQRVPENQQGETRFSGQIACLLPKASAGFLIHAPAYSTCDEYFDSSVTFLLGTIPRPSVCEAMVQLFSFPIKPYPLYEGRGQIHRRCVRYQQYQLS